MSAKQQLHMLIDEIDEGEYSILLHLLAKFVSRAEILPDEIEHFERAELAYANNDVISHKDINWD